MAKRGESSTTRRGATAAPGKRGDARGRAAASADPAPSQNGQTAAIGADGAVPWLTIRGARHNNLRNLTVDIPLARFVCVTGVSGSGKSSLVNDILHEALHRELNGATTAEPGAFEAIDGLPHLDKVIAIDQTPIGRTPRSNPATYIKVFDEIRRLFTQLPDAKLRGYKPGRFSFNVSAGPKGGGRCEACEGNGAKKIEMDFLADVWVRCPVCDGKRFARETLQVQFKHKSIADVLEMDVGSALEHFDSIPRVRAMLQTLHDVGLDYIRLGQPSTTLSGGEAQRIKLARELVKKPTGRTMYILDEPTTGLHFEDVRKLLEVLHGFVDSGNSVVVIEHNLDVIKTCDWIIDLGPEGGAGGGELIVAGTPEEVASCERSHTGVALREALAAEGALRDGAAHAKAEADKTAPRAPVEGPPISRDAIRVVGARQHNLKDVSVTLPRDRISVCTGVSGSGKTSFAIDTVFTEGYRRYVESLSAYARQFLGQMAKPRVDHVEGLSPAICIEQKAASKSPRSTVGTVTEIFDYLRVLWARVGTPTCPRCDLPMGAQTVDEIVDRITALDVGAPIMILAPVALGDGESYATMFTRLKRSGYTRLRIDGQVRKTEEATALDARRKHRVEVVIDRTIVRSGGRGRIAEGVEHAVTLGGGVMTLLVEAVEQVEELPESGANEASADAAPQLKSRKLPEREILFSQKLACTKCGNSYEELGPQHFSFNSQFGWCETCEGLGVQRGAPAAAIIRQPGKSIFAGAIAGWGTIDKRAPLGKLLIELCDRLGVSPDAPLSEWTAEQKNALMFGTTGDWIEGGNVFDGVRFHWRGFFPTIDAATRNSVQLRHKLNDVVTDIPCTSCRGGRLRPDAAAVRLAERTIVDICNLPLRDAAAFFERMKLDAAQRRIAGELLSEIRNRLQFLIDVGLDYVTLHRAAPTLSGGEAQRIRLASQIGSGLSGVLYVLDEPTIGLHPRDTGRLIHALHKLRDLGNTLLLVEHDRDVIRGADRIVDFGPRAGRFGGQIVAEGEVGEFAKATPRGKRAATNGDDANAGDSLTRGYLNGAAAIPVPTNRRPVSPWSSQLLAMVEDAEKHKPRRVRAPRAGDAPAPVDPDGPVRGWLVLTGARQHNLRNVTAPLPIGRLSCITGVSGSGKSSLVNDILWPALARKINKSSIPVGEHDALLGIHQIDKVINVDQSPIGTTPASNPATYTGLFDWVRELYARLPDSKVRGYEVKRFSFNRPGGRCEACEGNGQKCIEMHFMPDVWVECEVCKGRRYNPETLEIRYKGKNIADVLEMSVAEALELFENVPRIRRILQTLADVGLDYVQLGQPAPTLSGGEAQRVKLSAELAKPDTGNTLYLLDEPTTGLHFDDVRKLLGVLHRLTDLGNTVVVVEHNLDVLKSADWLVDLGPEAGDGGGEIVALGPPEAIAAVAGSHTGAALRPLLEEDPREARKRYDPKEHARQQLEDEQVGLGDVGKDTKMPWQVDGRHWHLEQRSSRNAKETRWQPAALEFVEQLVQANKGFAPTNWNNRASVEITAAGAETWFLHALTGGEWLLELYFLAPRGAFNARKLNAELKLKTLDERDDLPTYGNWPRVDVRERQNGVDAVVVYVHDREEIDTPAFRRFIKQAATAYLKAFAPKTGPRKSRKSDA